MFLNRSKHHKQPIIFLLAILIILVAFSSTTHQALAGSDVDEEDCCHLLNHATDTLANEADVPVVEIFQPIDQSQIKTFSMIIPQLDHREREIIVFLPPTYQFSNEYFPVIYLQNAQEIFIPSVNSMEEWTVNPTLFSFFNSSSKDEAILVGITSDFDHYWDEYSPWVNDQMYAWVDPYYAEQQEGGEAAGYLDFIVDHLKPEIDLRYRTLPDRESTAIGGYDMGGLFSLYAGLTRSDTFSKVLALSPAVWFAENNSTWLSDNQLINLIAKTNLKDMVTFQLDVGADERRIDLDVQPDVYDHNGNQITYAQAYLQGALAVTEALLNRGFDLESRMQESAISPMWVDDQEEDLPSLRSPAYSYHFPLFFKQDMENFTISMTPYLDRSRRIWVYLPPDYNLSDQSYPVLYVMDALRQFNPFNSSTIPEDDDWKTDEILDGLYDSESFPGIIVVGIEHHPTTYRWSEYNRFNQYNMDNWVSDGSEVIFGEGTAFVEFIVNKLKPTIDSRYRTLSGREHTAIGGGSRVGHLALNAGLTHHETFSKVMAMSPAFWMAEGGRETDHPIWLSSNRLVSWINYNPIPTNVQFYLYVGGNEDKIGSSYPYVYRTSSIDSKITYSEVYLEGAEAIRSALTSKGISPIWRYQADGTHKASYWRNYIVDALTVFGFYPGVN